MWQTDFAYDNTVSTLNKRVGARGFEPPISRSRTVCSSRTEPHPEQVLTETQTAQLCELQFTQAFYQLEIPCAPKILSQAR
jgi:hypothetical protein